ncbi:hypothetical protein [Leptolyngbya sp. GGD]|uniref:hypothetical protein n=1 Tax=Leptolyngbya sp. GGD TaxID=2997907 RepID=UPI00227C45B5|nr:hypothetical protein [Leptolyngbya sp. GGD]MCY6489123.1 hypothetical protein [Leptolyngbya sp. GGD]
MLMKTPYQTVWTPPAQIRDHNGVLLHPDTFFFASPPPEIGAVISASGVGITEELNRSRRTPILQTLLEFVLTMFSSWILLLSSIFYLFLFAILSLVVIAFGFLVGILLNSFGIGSIWAWLGGGLATVLFAWMYITMFRPPRSECSFVGALGIAHYWQTRKGIKGEVLRFSETTGLRKRMTRIYRNGLYHRTSFEYSWNNQPFLSDQPTMKQRFSISGAAPDILVNDAYLFAQAAERVWTAIRLQRAQSEFAQVGVARFSTAKDIDLEVGSGFINVVFRNREPGRIEAQELELTTGNGDLAIRRKTYGQSSGRFNPLAFVNVVFRADEIEDLDVFLRLVNTIVLQKS